MPTVYWPLALTLLLTAAAAVWDLRTGMIPNRLVAAGAALTLLCSFALAAPGGLGALGRTGLSMLMGAVLVSIVPALLYRMGGLGGGDLKLLAVVGAALGPSLGLEAELYAFFVVLLYAPARLIFEGKLRRALTTSAALCLRPFQRKPAPLNTEELTEFRFGPAIFAGTLAVALLQLSFRAP
jgi:prepilin peptidase CpaA